MNCPFLNDWFLVMVPCGNEAPLWPNVRRLHGPQECLKEPALRGDESGATPGRAAPLVHERRRLG